MHRLLLLCCMAALLPLGSQAASLRPLSDTVYFQGDPLGLVSIEMEFKSLRKWHVKNDGHCGACAPNFILEKRVEGKWVMAYSYLPNYVLDLAVQGPVGQVSMSFEVPIASSQYLSQKPSGEQMGEASIDSGTYRIKIQLDRGGKKVRTLASTPFEMVL